jgi:site-specific DNA recombinase
MTDDDQQALPTYDMQEQGVDQDRDRRAPATIERDNRGNRKTVRHQVLAERLGTATGPLSEILGQAPRPPHSSGASHERTIRCVIYVRVSTEEQAKAGGEAEGYSIPYQRETCLALAKQRGWFVVDIYVDAGESARSAKRPELQRMLRDLKAKHIDYVIVHKIDRLARNRGDDVEINKAIAAAGAKLFSVAEPIDDSPSGRLFYNMMADVAQYHSDNLAVEVLKGMSTKAQLGGTPYMAPIGYLNLKEVINGQIIRSVILDEERAPLIKWCLTEYATGDWSLLRLREELERKGLRSRARKGSPAKPVSLNGLYHLLHNPYYAGIVLYKGAYYQGKHEPLIDVDTWLRIQDVLAAHNRSGEKDRKHPHYLKGTIFCGECGGRLVYSRNKGHGGIYEYFCCLNRHAKRRPCSRSYYRLETIEAGIERFYGTFQLRPDHVAQLRLVVRHELRAEHQRAEDDAARAAKTLQRVKDQQAKLLEAHYQGAVPLDLLKVEMDRLTRERANAETELKLATTTLVELDAQLERILAVAGNCQAEYQAAAEYPAIRRQINQGLFVKLLISQDGNVERAELTEPFATVLSTDQAASPMITVGDERTPTASRITQDAPADDGSMEGTTREEGSPRDALGDRSRPSVVLLATFGQVRDTECPEMILSGQGSKDKDLVPPAGFEPALPPPEGGALSPELRGPVPAASLAYGWGLGCRAVGRQHASRWARILGGHCGTCVVCDWGWAGVWAAVCGSRLREGDRVVGTARRPEQLDDLVAGHGNRLVVLPLEVSDRAAVFDTVERAVGAFGRLDVVINNAGYGLTGAVEEITEAEAREIMTSLSCCGFARRWCRTCGLSGPGTLCRCRVSRG